MAHGTNIISKIKLPNNITYEIHDKEAIHSLADIEALGLEGAFIFRGTVATVSALNALPATEKVVGYVYHVTENGSEYVWITENRWEEFGHHIVVDHTHGANLTVSGSATVTGTNSTSSVSGSATITGTNAASTVTGKVAVPTVSKEANYIKTSIDEDTFVKSYPGATSKMDLVSIVPAADSGSKFITAVTPTTGSITGVSGSTTASKATAGTAVEVAKAGTAKSIPNVTNVGSASTWDFAVADGLLTISGTNSVAPTLGTAISVTPAVSNGNITPYTFADITVPVAAAATTVVTGVSSTPSTVNAAKVGTAVSVADGTLSSSGTGASVMTGLGTATTATALTSASIVSATAADGTLVGDTVTVGTKDESIKNGSAAAQTWTQASGTISGTAAAQTWTQKTGTISGTASGNTGAPNA